jgi:hypothetical protein
MASSRPSRVSKTTAMLLNKVVSGTLDEFLGEAPYTGYETWPGVSDVGEAACGVEYEEEEEAPPKREREAGIEEGGEDEEYSEVRAVEEQGDAESPIVLEEEEEEPVAIVKKPQKIAKKAKKAKKIPRERKEQAFSAPTRQLPLRKSVEQRAVGGGLAEGDYVADSRFEELVDRLAAASHDRGLRRDGADPDPNSRRIWDTECHVLGRGLLVGRSTLPGAGFGLFAAQDFPKGVLVTEYVGEEISKAQAFALRAAGKDQYIRSLKNGFCIDGNKYPGLGESCAQMANDGRDLAVNNCVFVATDARDKVQEKPRVYLKTLQHVSAGEELLASYGKKYWEFHGQSSESSPESGESSNVEADNVEADNGAQADE